MNSANHVVMRQIMELETPSREAAFGLQQRIGAWCRNVLPALLDQICTRCDGGDRVFRIDRLEIDLGRISALHLEEEIGARIATMLYEALREKVDQLRLPEDSGAAAGRPQHSIRGSPKISTAIFGDRMLSPVDADLELILYFLDTGSLPWSTVAGTVEPLEEKLKKLMETAPDQIDAILKFVAARPVARRRLIVQFGHDVLWALVRHASSDRGLRLEPWLLDFEAAVAAADLDGPAAIELRESFWDSVFQHATVLSEKSFATITFWQQTVFKAAERSGLGAEKIIAALLEGARQAAGASVSLQSMLAITLKQLTERSGYGPDRSRFAPIETFAPARQTEKEISPKTSDPMLGPQGKNRMAPKVENQIGDPSIAETQTPPADQRSSLHGREAAVSSAPRPTPQDLSKKSHHLDPGPEGTNLTALARSQSSAEKIAADARQKLPDRVMERQENKSKFSDGYRPRFRHPTTEPSAGIATPERAAPVPLAGLDAETALQEIYVDNAGLVIVWPFLSNFFKTLELLEKNNFVDDGSKVRAVYLLQYLATGEEVFPEYVLPLNKLLCGWDIGEPLRREYRLTDMEKSESHKLLDAVIGHWVALKQTSVDGLRTSFMQRNAVLIETMRHWLLRVERKPYDMLLERLPWGISMIRLSWMKKVLTVEW